jgi:hypothetical protein
LIHFAEHFILDAFDQLSEVQVQSKAKERILPMVLLIPVRVIDRPLHLFKFLMFSDIRRYCILLIEVFQLTDAATGNGNGVGVGVGAGAGADAGAGV